MKLLIALLIMVTLKVSAQTGQQTLRVDKISTNTGTIFGLRLNEDNTKGSKAADAEIECNKPESLFLIGFCSEGFCDTSDFDGDIFHNFYEHNAGECYKVQNDIKRIIKNGQSACLKISGSSLTVKAIKKLGDCK